MTPKERDELTEKNIFKKKAAIKLGENLSRDPRQKDRQEKRHCKICYYTPKVGGRAITRAKCEICEADMLFPSTIIDKYCEECSDRLKCCAHCGCGREY